MAYFNVNMLMRVAHFFGVTPTTGLNTINNLSSKILKRSIDVTNPYVSWFTRPIMVKQIKLYFSRLRNED